MAGVLAAGLVLAACGGFDDDAVSVSQVSDPPDTTEATTTTQAEATTTTEAEATTTTEPEPTTPVQVFENPGFGEEWDPACQNVIPSPDLTPGGPIQDVLEEFRPLEQKPSFRIAVPTSPLAPEVGEGRDPAYVRVGAVDGGLLLGFTGSGQGESSTSRLAMVDHSGLVYWVRCFDAPMTDLVSAPAGLAPAMVLVGTMPDVSSPTPARVWTWVSVSDGTPLGTLDETSGTDIDFGTWSVAAQSGIHALIVSDTYNEIYPSRVAVLDLTSGQVTELAPFPQEYTETSLFTPYYGFTSSGEVAAFGGGVDAIAVAAVWLDGAWTSDVAAISDSQETRVVWSYATEPPALVGVDPLGMALWRNDTLQSGQLEGSWISQDGDVAVLQSCTDPVPDAACGHSLLGIDPATGAELWRIPGFRNTPIGVADGLVLTNSGDIMGTDEAAAGWIMIDALTGTEIPNQRWDRGPSFYAGCCGEGEYYHVHRLGAVVVTVSAEEILVWYPRDLDVPDSPVLLP